MAKSSANIGKKPPGSYNKGNPKGRSIKIKIKNTMRNKPLKISIRTDPCCSGFAFFLRFFRGLFLVVFIFFFSLFFVFFIFYLRFSEVYLFI